MRIDFRTMRPPWTFYYQGLFTGGVPRTIEYAVLGKVYVFVPDWCRPCPDGGAIVPTRWSGLFEGLA